MPRPIIYEGKELTTQEFSAKLQELKEQKNYTAIADLTYQVNFNKFDAQDGDMSYVEVLDNFFTEITTTIPDDQLSPEDLEKKKQLEADYENETGNKIHYQEIDRANNEVVLGLLDAFNKKYHDAVVDTGKRRDAYQQQIREGNVPGTELFKDDPRSVKGIAHDFVMLDDGVGSDAMVDTFRHFSNHLYNKTINIKETGVLIKEAQDNYVANAARENNVNEAFIKEYIENYEERAFKMNDSNGYKYKKGPFAPNESRFEKYPDHVKAVIDCKSEAELDALEEKYQKQIDAYYNYERQIKSAAKISQTLYDEFKSIDWPDKDSTNYKDVDFGFEHFTHLGTDYKFASPDVLSPESRRVESLTNKPVKDAPPNIVENAVANANKSLEDFFDDVAAKIQDLEDKGETDSPEYENAQKMAAVLQKFNSVKMTAETLAAGHKEEFHTVNNRLNESKAGLEFINRKRAQMKLPVLAEADDEYTSEIDNALDELSDSIVDCNIRPEGSGNRYENVARALMEHKRLYKKYLAADQADDDKLAEKYAKQLEKQAASTKKLIKNCISYDKSTANEDGHTMGKAERRPLLTALSDNMSNKTKEITNSTFEKSYDKYIRLHTGKNAGKTVGERKQNLLKAIAASYLKQAGQKFSVDAIHNFAKSYDAKYCVTDNYAYKTDRGGHDLLMNATRNASSVIREGNRLRKDMYGIKNDQYDQYIADMNTLAISMRSDEGRSTEYQNLVKAIKAAAALDETTAGMTPDEKQEAFINANFAVVKAVKNYVKGKEKIRIQDKGNEAFNNSMDALAIVSKYTKQEGLKVNHAISKVYGDILKKGDREYLEVGKLEKQFGAKRAAETLEKREQKEAAKNKNKNKKTETKKTNTMKK